MALNVINGLLCYHLKMLTVPYFIAIELNYLVLGGIFAVFPAPVIKTFGIYYGPQIYSLVLLGSPTSSIFNLISIKVLYGYFHISEIIILAVGAVCSALAMVVLCFFSEKLDFENMQRRGLLIYGDPVPAKTK